MNLSCVHKFKDNGCFCHREGSFCVDLRQVFACDVRRLLSLLQCLLNDSSDLAEKLGEKSSGTVICPAMENLCP